MVRDLFHVAGLLGFDPQGQLTSITLNRAAPLAAELAAALPQAVGFNRDQNQGRRHLAGQVCESESDHSRGWGAEQTESRPLIGEVCDEG